MFDNNKQVIEINGIKLEVDMRYAKRIDTLTIGSRVKCLVKTGYSDENYKSCPGVVVGFEPFKERPAIVVAYIQSDYNSSSLKFRTITAETKDFEIVAAVDDDMLELTRDQILQSMDRAIETAQLKVAEELAKKEFFLAKFGAYFPEAAGILKPMQEV